MVTPTKGEYSIVDNIYYLYSEGKGLVRFEKSKKYQTVTNILTYFEVDPKFLENISSDRKFKDIIMILNEYEKWKADKELQAFL